MAAKFHGIHREYEHRRPTICLPNTRPWSSSTFILGISQPAWSIGRHISRIEHQSNKEIAETPSTFLAEERTAGISPKNWNAMDHGADEAMIH